MKYMLMIYGDEAQLQRASPADVDAMMGAYVAYTQELIRAGALVGGDRLQRTSAATTVRMKDGRTEVVDGPYAETKEQLGGYYLIDVPDLDSALSWAARCPGAQVGSIEVRPVWPS